MTPPLAVITNNRHEVFQRSVIAGVTETAERRGFGVSICEVSTPPALASPPLDPSEVAGAVVIANVLPDAALGALAEARLPMTLVNHRVASLGVPSVMHNNAQGLALLMEHLIVGCGRVRPVFIRGDMTQRDGLEREAAFRQEAMRYALRVPDEHFLRGDFAPAVAAASLERVLERDPAFDAVVAADYLMALAALAVLREAGRDVPAGVAVVGFGDGPEAAAAGLTTVAADVVELGRRGARQLIGQLEGLRIRGSTLLKTTLVARQTSCQGR